MDMDQQQYPVQYSHIKRFMFAGRSIVTLHSLATDHHYTYQITLANECRDLNRSLDYTDWWYVKLLIGPNNTKDYTYIGTITGDRFRLTARSKLPADSKPVRAFAWAFERIMQGRPIDGVEVLHSSRCGRCGRRLTRPDSLEMGIGPECYSIALERGR